MDVPGITSDLPAEAAVLLGQRGYECLVPTLHGTRTAASAHHAVHGPALLVLDEVEMARPYWQAFTDDPDYALPHRIRLTEAASNRWRAADCADLAEQRPDAPTVVVLHHEAGAPDAQQAMLDVSLLAITVSATPVNAQVSVTANRRNSLFDAWGPEVQEVLLVQD